MLEPVGDNYPQFMRSTAWLDKQLNTALGSWTELRHDTLLYAKQVYAEMGAGALPPPTPEPPKGYVEPVPEVYARISALASMTLTGLKDRGLLLEADEQALTSMVEIATRLQTISEKELRGEALTDEEYEKIRFYGGDIERLTFAAGLDPSDPLGGQPQGATPQAAIVADVATNPNDGVVLEEGVGRVFPIYVVVPIEGKLTVTIGGVFSQYEFEHPIDDRLTDEAWQEMLDAGNAPPLEDWKTALMVEETPAKELADTIRTFNDKLTEALWFTDISHVQDFLIDPELSDTQSYIDQLKGCRAVRRPQASEPRISQLRHAGCDACNCDDPRALLGRATQRNTVRSPVLSHRLSAHAHRMNRPSPIPWSRMEIPGRSTGSWSIPRLETGSSPKPCAARFLRLLALANLAGVARLCIAAGRATSFCDCHDPGCADACLHRHRRLLRP